MSRLPSLFTYVLVLGCVVWLSGCGSSAETHHATVTSSGSGDHGHGSDSIGSHDHGDHDGDNMEHEADAEALGTLSAEDQMLVVRQKICPVTEAALGSMGAPIKVRVKDRDVFICCEGCRDELLENADQYLAKLNL